MGAQRGLEAALGGARIVPVLVIERIEDAVPLGRALVAGGLPVLEVTLRTPVALDAIRRMAEAIEGASLGVGTVLSAGDLDRAATAGARFAVSPGATPDLVDAAVSGALPLLPGATTPSESMRLLERGFAFQKFFPAEPSGGTAYLASLASPLPQIRFCPTGGITAEKAPAYLKLANVFAVGGSWMVPKERIAAQDWTGIEALAREAVARTSA